MSSASPSRSTIASRSVTGRSPGVRRPGRGAARPRARPRARPARPGTAPRARPRRLPTRRAPRSPGPGEGRLITTPIAPSVVGVEQQDDGVGEVRVDAARATPAAASPPGSPPWLHHAARPARQKAGRSGSDARPQATEQAATVRRRRGPGRRWAVRRAGPLLERGPAATVASVVAPVRPAMAARSTRSLAAATCQRRSPSGRRAARRGSGRAPAGCRAARRRSRARRRQRLRRGPAAGATSARSR